MRDGTLPQSPGGFFYGHEHQDERAAEYREHDLRLGRLGARADRGWPTPADGEARRRHLEGRAAPLLRPRQVPARAGFPPSTWPRRASTPCAPPPLSLVVELTTGPRRPGGGASSRAPPSSARACAAPWIVRCSPAHIPPRRVDPPRLLVRRAGSRGCLGGRSRAPCRRRRASRSRAGRWCAACTSATRLRRGRYRRGATASLSRARTARRPAAGGWLGQATVGDSPIG